MAKRVSAVVNRSISDSDVNRWKKLFASVDKNNSGHILRSAANSLLNHEPLPNIVEAVYHLLCLVIYCRMSKIIGWS